MRAQADNDASEEEEEQAATDGAEINLISSDEDEPAPGKASESDRRGNQVEGPLVGALSSALFSNTQQNEELYLESNLFHYTKSNHKRSTQDILDFE